MKLSSFVFGLLAGLALATGAMIAGAAVKSSVDARSVVATESHGCARLIKDVTSYGYVRGMIVNNDNTAWLPVRCADYF